MKDKEKEKEIIVLGEFYDVKDYVIITENKGERGQVFKVIKRKDKK